MPPFNKIIKLGRDAASVLVFQFCAGRPFTWDATCSDTFSCGNLVSTTTSSSCVAHQAEKIKMLKYWSVFVIVVTSNVLGPWTYIPVYYLWSRDVGAIHKCEPHASAWLFQCISLSILWGNIIFCFVCWDPEVVWIERM